MGMAVVATSVACAGLRCRNGENILVADRADLFAGEVVRLLRDPSERVRLGKEGRKVAEQYYGWDTAARQLDSLYQACVGPGRRTGPQACDSTKKGPSGGRDLRAANN